MRAGRLVEAEQPLFWTGTVAHMPRLLHELGCDAAAVLERLDPRSRRIFGAPAMAPLTQAVDLFNAGAAVTGRADFGLRLGARHDPRNAGSVGHLLLAAPTLEAMLGAWQRHAHLIQQGGAFAIVADGNTVELHYCGETADAERGRQDVEFSLACALAGIRTATALRLTPVEAGFRHSARRSMPGHAAFFGCPLRFDQPANRLVLSRRPNHRLAAANAALFDNLDEYLQAVQQGPGAGRLGYFVRRTIAALLPQGAASLESVAHHLDLSTRTLQRRLVEEEGGFHRQLDAVREELARNYVLETRLSMTRIAQQLGYSESSAFTRSYLRWTGIGPARHRRLRPAGAADDVPPVSKPGIR